jgi:hypothetical protein
MRRALLAIVLLLALAVPVQAATFYVDCASSGGDGTTQALSGATAAFATIAAMQAKAGGYAADDQILLKRGCVWRETLTVPSSGAADHPITFGAYGTGAAPELNGSDIVTGFSNTPYVPAFTTAITAYSDSALLRNVRNVIPASAGSLDGTSISVTFRASHSAWTITGASIGPMAANALFDAAPTRLTFGGNNGVTVPADGVVTSDPIDFVWDHTARYGVHWYGDLHAPQSNAFVGYHLVGGGDQTLTLDLAGAVENFLFGVKSVNVQVAQAANVYGAVVDTKPLQVIVDGARGTEKATKAELASNNDWFWEANVLYLYSTDDPASKVVEAQRRTYGIRITAKSYVTLTDLYISKAAYGVSISASSYITLTDVESGWHAHVAAYLSHGGPTSYITMTGGSVHDTGPSTEGHGVLLGSLGDGSNHVTVQGVESYNNYRTGICADATSTGQPTTDYVVQRNHIHGNGGNGVSWAGKGHTISIRYNLIHDNGGWGVHDNSGDLVGPTVAEIYNNTVYGNTLGGVGHTTATFTVKNNILVGNGDGATGWYEISSSAAAVLTSDYNAIYHAGNVFQKGGTAYNFAGWQGEGYDAHSLAVDPTLVNAAAGQFLLAPGSPCIDAGADVGLTSDYTGRTVPQGTAPDIGAYEFKRSGSSLIVR